MKQLWNLGLAVLSVSIMGASGCGGTHPGSTNPIVDTQLQATVRSARVAQNIPALGALVIRGDKEAFAVEGVRRIGNPSKATTQDLWHLGSCSKAFTSTLAGILVDEGKLKWNLTLAEAFPDLAPSMRNEYRSVTLEMLLSLRGGVVPVLNLEELGSVPSFTGTRSEQRRAFTQWALGLPPNAKPGTYDYSNGSYIVATAMIERQTGKPWESLISERVLTPLGIRAARLEGWPASGGYAQPWGHIPDDKGVYQPLDPDDSTLQLPAYMTPAGGMSLTLSDYARFLQMNLKGLQGEKTLLSVATLQKLHRPISGGTYALGWDTDTLNGRTVSRYFGSAGPFLMDVVIDAHTSEAIVSVTNSGEDNRSYLACESVIRSTLSR